VNSKEKQVWAENCWHIAVPESAVLSEWMALTCWCAFSGYSSIVFDGVPQQMLFAIHLTTGMRCASCLS
jgi:hypothetical protein